MCVSPDPTTPTRPNAKRTMLIPSPSSLPPPDDDDAQPNYRIGDPILHIELRRWADVVLIAPCDANTLAKIATGICDNLVVSSLSPFHHARLSPTYFSAIVENTNKIKI